MLRVMGLALLLTVGAAVPAAADEAKETRVGNASQGPIGVPTAVAVSVASPEAVGEAALAALAPERRERGGWIRLPWLAEARSGFAIPLSERFSLGIGYRHVEAEDLWREFADAGSVDYESHNILLRANWRF